eukprot:gb/GEZJ01000848.1/.p1 GENE.gb/GEZJ01000848.1/~~gb/GEZJ01000848.1/.p1  ORF type:complete len:312 (-),score=17.52 gb/GEZJ01000848.1/:444-1379(-)
MNGDNQSRSPKNRFGEWRSSHQSVCEDRLPSVSEVLSGISRHHIPHTHRNSSLISLPPLGCPTKTSLDNHKNTKLRGKRELFKAGNSFPKRAVPRGSYRSLFPRPPTQHAVSSGQFKNEGTAPPTRMMSHRSPEPISQTLHPASYTKERSKLTSAQYRNSTKVSKGGHRREVGTDSHLGFVSHSEVGGFKGSVRSSSLSTHRSVESIAGGRLQSGSRSVVKETMKRKKCDICCKMFATEKYQQHRKLCRHVLLNCSKCSFTTNKTDFLRRHEATHRPEEPYIFGCPICSAGFPRYEDVVVHRRLHHSKRRL